MYIFGKFGCYFRLVDVWKGVFESWLIDIWVLWGWLNVREWWVLLVKICMLLRFDEYMDNLWIDWLGGLELGVSWVMLNEIRINVGVDVFILDVKLYI